MSQEMPSLMPHKSQQADIRASINMIILSKKFISCKEISFLSAFIWNSLQHNCLPTKMSCHRKCIPSCLKRVDMSIFSQEFLSSIDINISFLLAFSLNSFQQNCLQNLSSSHRKCLPSCHRNALRLII